MTNHFLLPVFLLCLTMLSGRATTPDRLLPAADTPAGTGFTDAADFGFSPANTGAENAKSLQAAVDGRGTVVVTTPGVYKIAATVYVESHTTLRFGAGVTLQKVNESGTFTHVLLNKGALTKDYNESIRIDGLHLMVNGIDKPMDEVYGLRGQIAFFYVKDLQILNFRCYDLTNMQFGIHVCTFEDLLIDNVIIEGNKDGVHLGKGKRFTIRNGVFRTYDDAIALNAHDYATSNPELGWIENGIIENCHDLNDGKKPIGYFCRILAGAWIDWKPGMEVQQSDAVVSNGRVYRVQEKPDGKIYKSVTRPTHAQGSQVVDGINWGVVQDEVTYTAGVRNVTFRSIFLEKPRIGFSIHFDNDRYSRSYYPGAPVPMQEQLLFEDVRVLFREQQPFISVNTPVNTVTVSRCSLWDNPIRFHGNGAMNDYLPTHVNLAGNVFNHPGVMDLINCSVAGKEIFVKTSSSLEAGKNFSAKIVSEGGGIKVEGDLTGLE